jgi:hypothetical protein
MKQFFDTLSVFVANILRLEPKSWSDAKQQAIEMRRMHDNFKPSTVFVDGKETAVIRDQSPFAYLGDAVLNAVGFVLLVWLIQQVVVAFVALLPILFVLAVFGLTLSVFAAKRAEPTTP